ncbi:unnamed protein product [Cuscuta europaea]|uniref:Uncharacterized protein n=1 Tax=Cuscuta europaea TaxID=41803 RepID=A0A9P0YSX1_CUSEU|nr:unnamed protein product [Cuscuta europaea]
MEDFGGKWNTVDPVTGQLPPTPHARYMANYSQRMEEKYGPDRSQHPVFDYEIWTQITGPPKKGRLIGVPDQISHPELFQPSKPEEDRCVILEHQVVDLKTEIETIRVGMLEFKTENEKIQAENVEQRTHFNSTMSNIWGVLINMGVVNPNMIPFNFGSSQQHPAMMFGQQSQLHQHLPSRQQPGSFSQLIRMTYAQAQHEMVEDQPPQLVQGDLAQPKASQCFSRLPAIQLDQMLLHLFFLCGILM